MTVLRHLPWLLSMFIVSSFAQDIPEWDFFTFTQQWPQSVCIAGKQEGKTCKIPKQVDYWTIHGLWPSDRGHERPKCPEVKFDPNLIKDLMVNLNLYWPDMYNRSGKKPSDKFKFWSDEWKKHGSCARSLPATKNERLYFAKCLELRQKYDLLTMLKKCNIVPSSTQTYTSSSIANCYKNALGVSVEIRCINDKKKKRADFAETRLHLDKKFVLINIKTTDNRLKYNYSNTSTKGTEGCPRKGIYFLPIEH